MKFKGILTESLIDSLQLPKIQKALLKAIHKSDLHDMPQEERGWKMLEIAKKVAVPVDDVTKAWMTYEKYKDILFGDEGIAFSEDYDPYSAELLSTTRGVICKYIEDHHENKDVFPGGYEGITGFFENMESLEWMIKEEMTPSLYVRLPVDGTYEYTKRWGDQKGEKVTTEEVDIYATVWLGILPRDGKYGYDFISQSEESFGDWMENHSGRKSWDVIDTGNVKASFLKPLRNYSEAEVKRFCDQWVEVCKRIVKKNAPFMFKFKEFVEHGDTMFEGYNRDKNK
jgi:hypothetical protein